ncbi:3-methyl-2-oxobutanoate dehydrogenase subunit beta [Leucobacter aridicollis]|uniref:Pyruvate dehydrogenase E1 component beta subunit n=1 Tax=Leucobacter aridicollis TaxID=283878 RepID=A0A852R2U0_9MICO|nr:alpha-ketoacid dehydrogenase subunit beta [Leucobacter aridicollis]MBL3682517.1 alpha-ketoacid dehydrogenase subunit beta [Leucobacter aridicollis]MCS3426624.1 pyruvate dehydrogenase E1 component beta subunit [Leucobacter aridicollis]NYD25935.1 pyruvate dehydrogenase E1 component beta subunit [Leucobacter aridicollis]RKQ89231.1 pyruvate dehydrogenase E1 component beta subunit [Mycolicibacterium mucogenicum 261Sha1.1M5]
MSQSQETTSLAIARAINAGLREALSKDDNVVLLGQDIGALGGVFRVTDALAKDFGTARVLDMPLAEAGILGSAVGLAMSGFRPVAEIQFDGFVFPAMNQLVTQLAKLRNRSAGTMNMPVVLRLPYGGHIGAVEHHQESPEAYFAHTAGLRVVSPANANDAYWMIQQAIESEDPVIFLEPKAKYWQKGEVRLDRPAAKLHETLVAREGADVTLVGFGAMVTTLLQAAEIAKSEGVSAEVIDLRTVSPIDYGPIVESVRKTGRVVVAQEAPENASVGSEIAATLSERCFLSLEAPVLRVSGYDTPFPPAGNESHYLPDADRVLEAVDRALNY